MKLTTKLQIGFTLPALFLVAVGSASVAGFWNINQKVATIYDDRVVPLKQLKIISDAYAVNVIDQVNKANDGTVSVVDTINKLKDAQKTVEEQWKEYRATYLTAEETRIADEMEKLFDPAKVEVESIITELQNGKTTQLEYYDGDLYRVIDPLTQKIQDLIDLQLSIAQEERGKAEKLYKTILWTFIPLMTVTIILVLFPIRAFINNLIVATLRNTINTVASAATEIAASTEEQERLAAQQAASVNETTTTMDELNVSSKQSAMQAETASTGAQQVLSLSQDGNRVVTAAMSGMTDLKNQVSGIADAITNLNEKILEINTYQQLVGEIANQTNMLALNAAVEAVKAGEHGKGFAVVATEIRKLADQSKDSADKINQLVTDIQTAITATVTATNSGKKTADNGVNLAQQTALTFNNVAQAIDEVVVSVQQISLNAKQQAVAIGQVVDAMNSLNQAALQTATGITQTKIGTQKLSETAADLQATI